MKRNHKTIQFFLLTFSFCMVLFFPKALDMVHADNEPENKEVKIIHPVDYSIKHNNSSTTKDNKNIQK